MNEKMMEMLLKVHNNIPQEGPGSKESTMKAFAACKDLPEKARILDIGCGPGRQTLDLATVTKGPILAIDIFDQFLSALDKKIVEKKYNERIRTMKMDMNKLHIKPDSFDLIWSEGAIYIMGFEKGLNYWKNFVSAGGYIAVSEMTWLHDDPPTDLKDFWKENYPGLKNQNENLEIIKNCDLECVGNFTLPEKDWWNYYDHLTKRLEDLKKDADKDLLEYISMEEFEINLYKKYHEYYGYVFYIMKKS